MQHAKDVTSATDPDNPSPLYRYRFANVEFDESLGVLRVAGADVDIEPRPRDLLSELLHRPNEVIAKSELLDLLWEGRPTVENVLANAVNKLRRALGEAGAERIVNLARIGYRFTGPVERTVVGQHAAAPLALVAGQPVPGLEAFRLERPLGHGAPRQHSSVWLARDPKLHEMRVVKFATDGERLTALKREYTLYRVLLGELGERPDFTRVLSANFSTAPYFLASEYGGQDLLAWAAEGERLRAMPQPERLALFLQIARAVAAAHGVGVLHKDLKPANVLIAGDGEGWVARLTDFGSSRLLEPGRLAELGVTALGLTMTQGTDTGASGGTPLYLAPELLAGHSPTTGSDLYALGLMLYQLLVGDFRRPMSTGWERDIADPLLRQDLTAATEGRPEDRLGSVTEFAERLATLPGRHAEEAQRERERERAEAATALLQKSRARRPWVAAAFASLAMGLAASVWFYSQATSALHRAEQESARANSINEFLNKDVLQSADVIRAGNRKTISMIEVLRKAAAQASSRFPGQPRAEASVRYQIARAYTRMASIGDAEREFQKLLALLRTATPPNDPLRLAAQFSYVDMLLRTESNEDSDAASTLLAQTERDAGPSVLNSETELALLAANARFEVLMRQEKLNEALTAGMHLTALVNTLPSVDPAVRFEARQRLAELYLVMEQPDKAHALLDSIADAPGAAEQVGEVAYARARMKRAEIAAKAGNVSKAEAELIAVCEQLLRTMGPGELQLGLAEDQLARLYEMQGRSDRAEAALRVAISAFKASFDDDHQYVKVSYCNLAQQILKQGRSAEALQILDSLVPWYAAHVPGGNFDFEILRASALSSQGQPFKALAILDSFQPSRFAKDDPSDLRKWRVDAERAHAFFALGRRDEALPLMRSAIATGAKVGAYPAELAIYQQLIAKVPGAKGL